MNGIVGRQGSTLKVTHAFLSATFTVAAAQALVRSRDPQTDTSHFAFPLSSRPHHLYLFRFISPGTKAFRIPTPARLPIRTSNQVALALLCSFPYPCSISAPALFLASAGIMHIYVFRESRPPILGVWDRVNNRYVRSRACLISLSYPCSRICGRLDGGVERG